MRQAFFHLIFHLPWLVVFLLWPGVPPLRPATCWALFVVLLSLGIFLLVDENASVRLGLRRLAPGGHLFSLWSLPVEECFSLVLKLLEIMLLVHVLFQTYPTSPLMEEKVMLIFSPGFLIPFLLLSGAWIWTSWKFSQRFKSDLRRWHTTWRLARGVATLLVIQWIWAWPVLLPRWPYLTLTAMLFGSYWAMADYKSASMGLTFFDPRQTSGWKADEILPWERVIYWFLLCFLVAGSMTLMLPPFLR